MDHYDDPARELRRVVARLVALGPERLERAQRRERAEPKGAAAPGGTLHDVVQAWLQEMANLTADASSSIRRVVPRLRPYAVPDQVVVLTREALSAFADDAPARSDVARQLVSLRRSL